MAPADCKLTNCHAKLWLWQTSESLDVCFQVTQIPGIALYYSETIYGLPPVLIKQLTTFPMMHKVSPAYVVPSLLQVAC